MRRLPPLNSLRAFESAARWNSFTRAAEELNVTPGAISQQIRGLEAYLGQALFKRQNRSIRLTEHAQLCLPALTAGFNQLSDAIKIVEEYNSSRPLIITVANSFASKWLIPHLASFQEKHPEIDVRIDVSCQLVDIIKEDIDIGIRFGNGEYPDLESDYLLPVEIVPVCSPALLKTRPLSEPSDLVNHTLIHGDNYFLNATMPDWEMWLSTLGVSGVDASHGPRYSPSDMAIQAAIEGQGVALSSTVAVRNDLESGRLIQPFKETIPLEFAYYCVCSATRAERPYIRAFREWIKAEVDK